MGLRWGSRFISDGDGGGVVKCIKIRSEKYIKTNIACKYRVLLKGGSRSGPNIFSLNH